jgi:alpha-tubulin suppressor-like RCC1 family protein
MLALSEDGQVWSWGRTTPALGHEKGSVDESDQITPKRITSVLSNKKVVDIAAGFEHSAVLTGKFSWYYN